MHALHCDTADNSGSTFFLPNIFIIPLLNYAVLLDNLQLHFTIISSELKRFLLTTIELNITTGLY